MSAQPRRRTPLAAIGKKLPTCKVCRKPFERERTGQRVCSVACGLEDAKRKQVAKAVAPYVPARGRLVKKVHDRSRALRLCQKAFNALVRWQDRDLPCITCGTMADVKYDAGHWLTVGAHPELRFRRENCHRQCSNDCNVKNGGRPREYREALIERRGQAVVDWLEGPHDPAHWSVDEIDQMASALRAQLRWEKRHACGVSTPGTN